MSQIDRCSNHLSIHQWLCCAIHASQPSTSPIGFLSLKLPPPPCAVLAGIYPFYRLFLSTSTILISVISHVFHPKNVHVFSGQLCQSLLDQQSQCRASGGQVRAGRPGPVEPLLKGRPLMRLIPFISSQGIFRKADFLICWGNHMWLPHGFGHFPMFFFDLWDL